MKDGITRVEEDYIDNTQVNDGSVSIVKILLDEQNRVINNDELNWHNANYDEIPERYITLKEIFQQLKENGYEDIIYVLEESPLNGTIYMCGNYEKGQWVKHGTTRGYA